MKGQHFLFLLFAALLASSGCKEDNKQPATMEVATSEETVNESSTEPEEEYNNAPSSNQIDGFDYLSGCDSLLIEELTLTDPASGKAYSYVQGTCVTNKSYDFVLVPKSGHVEKSSFGSSKQVFTKVRNQGYNGQIAYAFILPKLVSGDPSYGVGLIQTLLPTNVLVYRLDNNKWVRLGVEPAQNEEELNQLKWRVLHDQPLAHN